VDHATAGAGLPANLFKKFVKPVPEIVVVENHIRI
jgi:hypothetical protein